MRDAARETHEYAAATFSTASRRLRRVRWIWLLAGGIAGVIVEIDVHLRAGCAVVHNGNRGLPQTCGGNLGHRPRKSEAAAGGEYLTGPETRIDP